MMALQGASTDAHHGAVDDEEVACLELAPEFDDVTNIRPAFAALLPPRRAIAECVHQVPHRLVESGDIVLRVHVAHGVALRRVNNPRVRSDRAAGMPGGGRYF